MEAAEMKKALKDYEDAQKSESQLKKEAQANLSALEEESFGFEDKVKLLLKSTKEKERKRIL